MQGMLVLLKSDLGDMLQGSQLGPFRTAAESLAASRLRFDSAGAAVYSFSR